MKRATGSIFVFNIFVQAWNVQVCVHTIYRVDVSASTYHLKSRFIFHQILFNVVCIKKGLLKTVLYIHIAWQYGFLMNVIIEEAGQFVETKFSLEQTQINWERLPYRLHKIYCKECILTIFLLPTCLSYEIRLQSPNEHLVVFSLHLETHQRTPFWPKQIWYTSGNRGRFSNMSGLSSSTAFNPRKSASSIWSLMIVLRGQITKLQPFDNTESIDVMIANTFPKPVGSTANTSFPLRRLFITKNEKRCTSRNRARHVENVE